MDTSPATKMNQNKSILPPECFDCGELVSWKLRATGKEITQFKGDAIQHNSEYYECECCSYTMMTPSQLKADILATVRGYQLKHDLLTAGEVVARRKALGLSQQAFHDIAKGVTLSSLKRLELGQRVQDISTDVAITTGLERLEEEHKKNEMLDFALHISAFPNNKKSTWESNSNATLALAATVALSFVCVKRFTTIETDLRPCEPEGFYV
jgi:hypothetical protein